MMEIHERASVLIKGENLLSGNSKNLHSRWPLHHRRRQTKRWGRQPRGHPIIQPHFLSTVKNSLQIYQDKGQMSTLLQINCSVNVPRMQNMASQSSLFYGGGGGGGGGVCVCV